MKDKSGIRTVVILAIIVILQSPIASASRKRKQAKAKALFQAAYATSGIEAKGSPPFHLKAQFKFYNSNYQLTKGSYEKIWFSPDRYRTSFSVPSGSDIIGVSKGRRWQKSTLPYTTFLESLVNEAMSFGSALEAGPPLKIKGVKGKASGTRHLTCVVSGEPYNYKAEFCFDPQNDRLVQQTYPVWEITCEYSDYQPWGGKWFPRMIEFVQNGTPFARITVKSVMPAGRLSPSVFVTPPGAEVTKQVSCRHPQLKTGKLIKKVMPTYPASSLMAHIQGTVGLYADIGRKGQVRGLQVIHSVTTALDAAALRAVRQWRYQPVVCKGVPREVVSAIEVNFDLQ